MKKDLTILVLVFFAFLGSTSQSFSLPFCPNDPNEYFHKCFGSFTTSDGDKYVGEWQNDEYHGKGVYHYLAANRYKGNKYFGEFRFGKANGKGTYVWADKSYYEGEFKDGKSHGRGIHYYPNGIIHREGVWENDILKYPMKIMPFINVKNLSAQ